VRRREFVAIVVSIEHDADSNLPKIAQALRNLGVLFGPRKRRKEKTYQYGDDRDNDQQFDKSESSVAVLHWIVLCFAVARGHKSGLRRVDEPTPMAGQRISNLSFSNTHAKQIVGSFPVRLLVLIPLVGKFSRIMRDFHAPHVNSGTLNTNRACA
jgi:hypothetical protein